MVFGRLVGENKYLEGIAHTSVRPSPLLDPPCLLMPTSFKLPPHCLYHSLSAKKRSDPEITRASLSSDKTPPEPKPILYNCYYCMLSVILPGICTLEQQIRFYGLLVDNVWNQISVFIISEVLLWVLLCKPYKQGYGWCYSVFVLSTNPIKRPKLNNVRVHPLMLLCLSHSATSLFVPTYEIIYLWPVFFLLFCNSLSNSLKQLAIIAFRKHH